MRATALRGGYLASLAAAITLMRSPNRNETKAASARFLLVRVAQGPTVRPAPRSRNLPNPSGRSRSRLSVHPGGSRLYPWRRGPPSRIRTGSSERRRGRPHRRLGATHPQVRGRPRLLRCGRGAPSQPGGPNPGHPPRCGRNAAAFRRPRQGGFFASRLHDLLRSRRLDPLQSLPALRPDRCRRRPVEPRLLRHRHRQSPGREIRLQPDT